MILLGCMQHVLTEQLALGLGFGLDHQEHPRAWQLHFAPTIVRPFTTLITPQASDCIDGKLIL